MKIKYLGYESRNFDPKVSQIVKHGFYIPYGNDQWVVLDDFVFWSHRIQAGILIPKWFLTDLASIPKGFRWLISVNEKHRDAALPHDVFYSFWSLLEIDKETADKIFEDFLIASDIPKWKRISMYNAVKWGGYSSWMKKEPRFCDDGLKYEIMQQYRHLECLKLPFENPEPVLISGY